MDISERVPLLDIFSETGDIRELIYLIEKYAHTDPYTEKDASEVINMYEPYENNHIPETEHIEVLLQYFPHSKISDNTMNAVKNTFPDRVDCIIRLQNRMPDKNVIW